MTARDFCVWFKGALDMAATASNGDVTFSQEALHKIQSRLDKVLENTETEKASYPMFDKKDKHARC